MRNVFKAIAAFLAVLALCAPLILWSAEEGVTTAMDPFATVTVPPTVIVTTTGSDPEPVTTTTTEAEQPRPSTTTTTAPIRITVAAVGDVLTHMPIVNSAKQEDGSYDFRPVFRPVAPYLRDADYAVANLETRLAGPEPGYSGYPLFNSPAELAQALRWAGVDLLATANNHSLDMGWNGIVKTLDHLDEVGLSHVGTYRSAEDRAKPFVVDIQGINVGFINHTVSLNGLVPPPDKEFAVNRLEVDQVVLDAMVARSWGADVVIALLHWGNEYQREPTEEHVTMAQHLLSKGVDVIIGAHPHVVQPIEHVFEYSGWRVTDKYVFYSLGNFVSNQRWRYSDSGLVAYVHIEKKGLRTTVTGVSYLPVYVQRTADARGNAFRVLPVLPGLVPDTDLPLSSGDEARMAEVWEELRPLLYRPNEKIAPLFPGELSPAGPASGPSSTDPAPGGPSSTAAGGGPSSTAPGGGPSSTEAGPGGPPSPEAVP